MPDGYRTQLQALADGEEVTCWMVDDESHLPGCDACAAVTREMVARLARFALIMEDLVPGSGGPDLASEIQRLWDDAVGV